MKLEQKRSWVEIDKKALKHNLTKLSKLVNKNVLKMAVVKSNAYGHGMVECAQFFDKSGIDFLAVDSFDEARDLRSVGIRKPILVLGWTSAKDFNEAIRLDVSLTISSLNSLKDAQKISLKNKSKKLKIHIKIDSGLHRQGFNPTEIPKIISTLSKCPEIIVEGLYSHLAAAESPKLLKYTKKQITVFEQSIKMFEKNGYKPITHISASAATILYPESHFQMVRFGISIYGLWPSQEVRNLNLNKINLKPALSWRSIVSEIKKIKGGEPVGYDCSEKVKTDSTIAIIPIGYWHGLPRSVSSKGEILIRGQKAKILGKVSMDMIVVDITQINDAKAGDIATIIGADRKNIITADNLAEKAGTINYEIVTRINPLITRIYL